MSPPYQEPNPIAKENPCRFHRLCFRAIAEAAISELDQQLKELEDALLL